MISRIFRTFAANRLVVVAGLLLATIQFSSAPSFAEDCPVIDYSKLSFGRAVPTANWKNADPVRVITWTSNATLIQTDQVSTPFSDTEQAWMQQAFDNFGEILDSVAFQKVESQADANISIGYTMLSKGKIPTETTGGTFGLWGFNSGLQKGGIQLLDPKLWPKNFPLFKSDKTFILPVQNEIGNVLGVPDVDPFGPKQSLISIYDTSKFNAYGQLKINDNDAAIIRQLYGESTCSSKYTTEERAKNLAADKIAGQQFLAKLAAPKSEPKSAPKSAPSATPSASPTPLSTASASTTAKATTITCAKGKLTKKVTKVKPVCPAGYKKK
jgi:hypothetical protein